VVCQVYHSVLFLVYAVPYCGQRDAITGRGLVVGVDIDFFFPETYAAVMSRFAAIALLLFLSAGCRFMPVLDSETEFLVQEGNQPVLDLEVEVHYPVPYVSKPNLELEIGSLPDGTAKVEESCTGFKLAFREAPRPPIHWRARGLVRKGSPTPLPVQSQVITSKP
jgi:hypothetical protein